MIDGKKVIWFMEGYSNLFHAINDLKNGDTHNNFKVLCTHNNPAFVGFESSDYFEVEPSNMNDQKFISFCEDIIKKYHVDVIFASNKQVLLDKNRKHFQSLGVEVATVASSKLIPSINNKAKLYKLLMNGPVKIPAFGVFNDLESFNEQYKKLNKNFNSLCMKPTHGVYGVGFYVLKNKLNDLNTFLSQQQKVSLHKFRQQMGGKKCHQMLLMQYLEGVERSVDCVAFHGQLVGGVIRKKIGGGLPQVIEKNDEIMSQVEWIVKKLHLNGMFNVQFKDYHDTPYLLEINPRLSGRSYYATIAGFNIPLIASELFSGLKTVNDIHYKITDNLYISAINYPVVATKYNHNSYGAYSKKESL